MTNISKKNNLGELESTLEQLEITSNPNKEISLISIGNIIDINWILNNNSTKIVEDKNKEEFKISDSTKKRISEIYSNSSIEERSFIVSLTKYKIELLESLNEKNLKLLVESGLDITDWYETVLIEKVFELKIENKEVLKTLIELASEHFELIYKIDDYIMILLIRLWFNIENFGTIVKVLNSDEPRIELWIILQNEFENSFKKNRQS